MTTSQESKILEYLQKGYSLTPLEALEYFGCFRLGARCFDLRKAGHDVRSELTKSPDGKKHFSTYWLAK